MGSHLYVELLAKLLKRHEDRKDADDSLNVERVVIVDQSHIPLDSSAQRASLDLLSSVSGVAGAATAIDAGLVKVEPIREDVDPVLFSAVQTEVSGTIDGYGSISLERHPSSGLLTINGSGPDDQLGKGHHALLQICWALLAHDWSGSDIGVLVYSEDGMDQGTRSACWRVISSTFKAERLGDLETLIVLDRTANLDPGLHLVPDHPNNATFVLEQGRFLKQTHPDDVKRKVKRLARILRDPGAKPFVLFLGAGFSASSSLPMGDDLRDRALAYHYPDFSLETWDMHARRLYRESKQAGRLDDWEAIDEEDFVADLTLEQVIELTERANGASPEVLIDLKELQANCVLGDCVKTLGDSLERMQKLVVVTVNFDELLERHAADHLQIFYKPDEYEMFDHYLHEYLAGRRQRVPYIKLHGTISDLPSCVMSARQTHAGLAEYKSRTLRTLSCAAGEARDDPGQWIYVGSSMRDLDLNGSVLDQGFPASFHEQWVTPMRSAETDRFARKRRAQVPNHDFDLDARTINISADRFFSQLTRFLDLVD